MPRTMPGPSRVLGQGVRRALHKIRAGKSLQWRFGKKQSTPQAIAGFERRKELVGARAWVLSCVMIETPRRQGLLTWVRTKLLSQHIVESSGLKRELFASQDNGDIRTGYHRNQWKQ